MDTFEWKMDIIIPINTMDSVLEIDERTHEALGGNGEVQQLEALIQQLSQGKSRFRLVLTSPDSDVVLAKSNADTQVRTPVYGQVADDMREQFHMSDYAGGGQSWSYDT